MIQQKNIRQRGKIQLSHYFHEFEKGDKVAVVQELALEPKFPKKLQGRSGTVHSKRGASYIVKINDVNREKTYIIHPVHLRKLT